MEAFEQRVSDDGALIGVERESVSDQCLGVRCHAANGTAGGRPTGAAPPAAAHKRPDAIPWDAPNHADVAVTFEVLTPRNALNRTRPGLPWTSHPRLK